MKNNLVFSLSFCQLTHLCITLVYMRLLFLFLNTKWVADEWLHGGQFSMKVVWDEDGLLYKWCVQYLQEKLSTNM